MVHKPPLEPVFSGQEIQRIKAKHLTTKSMPITLTIRHEWTLEIKEFVIISAEKPCFLYLHWPLCGDYKIDLRTNRMHSKSAGKKGKTRGAERWRVLDYQRALTLWNDMMKLEGNSRVRMETPQ